MSPKTRNSISHLYGICPKKKQLNKAKISGRASYFRIPQNLSSQNSQDKILSLPWLEQRLVCRRCRLGKYKINNKKKGGVGDFFIEKKKSQSQLKYLPMQ
ncbi:unnamed protein product [Allacma fusca]|uniref:Uncharacterized protein n=1 Tax=Allacma fusca TaxID=39272 RepID=A0A8J2LMI6_9HEXA|nr:unnamed protein product [Allacma fusca]